MSFHPKIYIGFTIVGSSKEIVQQVHEDMENGSASLELSLPADIKQEAKLAGMFSFKLKFFRCFVKRRTRGEIHRWLARYQYPYLENYLICR